MVKKPNSLDRLEAGSEAAINHDLLKRYPLFQDLIAHAERRIPKRIAGYFLDPVSLHFSCTEHFHFVLLQQVVFFRLHIAK